ncbi:MAG: gamma-glutamyl-gamma-aminobutyrate hydrolase family protein [Candidatus Binatia bacterium]
MSRRAPVIGITADFSPANRDGNGATREATHFLPHRYCHAVENAGGIALILPAIISNAALKRILAVVDGLVISGGDFDIHPSYYGEKPIAGLGIIKQERTEFELDLTRAALKRDMPVLGLCGGEQAINVVLGGTLYQDIPTQLPQAGNHQQSDKKEIGGHQIHVHQRTRLSEILRRRRIEVNTTHHQAVKRIGKGLRINATAEDGLIEGIESEQHSFVLGLQWHPEVLAPRHEHQRRIFAAFTAACAQRR